MLLKPEILTVLLHPTTQLDIWARSFWVQPQERSLPMGAATGGRHTVVAASTILILRHTAALTGVMVIILMLRLTTITIRELTAGMGVRMARTERPPPVLVTILTLARTREAVRSQHPMAVEVLRRRTTRIRERTRRRDRVRVRMLNGAAPMFHEGTRALPWGIIRLLMEL